MICKRYLFLFVLIGSLLFSCQTEVRKLNSPHLDRLRLYSDREVQGFKPLLTRYNLDPPLTMDYMGKGDQETPDLFAPFHKYSKMRYLGEDGTISMHYYLEAGTGHRVSTLLVGQIAGLTKVPVETSALKANQVTVFPNFIVDERRTAGVGSTQFSKFNTKKRNACDLMVVKADRGMLFEAERFIARVLTEIPQIEIKVRVIEVALQDRLEYGVDTLVSRDTTSSKSFLTPPQFDTNGNYTGGGWTTKFNTESVILSGLDKFQGSVFHVAGVHDKFSIDAFIELMQATSESQILSAPKVTVLNGHKAVIETGVDVPIQEVVTKVNETSFKYKYQPTGVKLVILPTLLMDDTLQIEVNGEVITISGEESVDTGTGTVNIPIFTTRNISSNVMVKDGETLAMGGLLATSEIEQVSKVPLLGDIPILGYFFKSKNTEVRKTQVIFFIEPRVVKPEEVLYLPE